MKRLLVSSLTALLVLGWVRVLPAGCPRGDIDEDCKVSFSDVELMAELWLRPRCRGPSCPADIDDVPGVNLGDFALLAQDWLADQGASIEIHWFDHASFKITYLDTVIYIDPRNLSIAPHDATLILVTHTHADHYSASDIADVRGPATELIGPADVIASEGWGTAILPGQTIDLGGVQVTGVAAYNTSSSRHPKSKNWLGFVVELGPWRIYNAGDTDLTDEMKALTDIDVAILPIGGTYTMDPLQAAAATGFFNPALALPAHRRSADPQVFATNASCDVTIMDPGQTITLQP